MSRKQLTLPARRRLNSDCRRPLADRPFQFYHPVNTETHNVINEADIPNAIAKQE